jgi:hypothetical protein
LSIFGDGLQYRSDCISLNLSILNFIKCTSLLMSRKILSILKGYADKNEYNARSYWHGFDKITWLNYVT